MTSQECVPLKRQHVRYYSTHPQCVSSPINHRFAQWCACQKVKISKVHKEGHATTTKDNNDNMCSSQRLHKAVPKRCRTLGLCVIFLLLCVHQGILKFWNSTGRLAVLYSCQSKDNCRTYAVDCHPLVAMLMQATLPEPLRYSRKRLKSKTNAREFVHKSYVRCNQSPCCAARCLKIKLHDSSGV